MRMISGLNYSVDRRRFRGASTLGFLRLYDHLYPPGNKVGHGYLYSLVMVDMRKRQSNQDWPILAPRQACLLGLIGDNPSPASRPTCHR